MRTRIKSLAIIILLILICSNFIVSANSESTYEETEYNLFTTGDSFDGYILYSPEFSKNTYLINNDGEKVHKWRSTHRQALPVYLLENGNLIRGCSRALGPHLRFMTGGFTGIIEMFNWDGELIWEYAHSKRKYCIHNDIEPLPNGNVLMTVWEYKTHAEAIAAGVDPSLLNFFVGLLIDHIVEVEPTFPKGGDIVWEWHAWDHIIQDYDSTKENYGVVADHPELININSKQKNDPFRWRIMFPLTTADFTHINSIDYDEELDQILLSSCTMSEIYVIDHSTTTKEAADHTGGKYGKGGDILYRWGNPQNYGAGDENDRELFEQHDARWIEPGYPGEGHITIFNNGIGRPDGSYSSVEEIIPPVDSNGNYCLESGSAYGPEEPFWSYTADPLNSFYSSIMSGAQRLPNGNTLICGGVNGIFFEVNPENELVWSYVDPFSKLVSNRLINVLDNVFKIQYYPPDYPGLQKLTMD